MLGRHERNLYEAVMDEDIEAVKDLIKSGVKP
jgi:hypothetical protein